MIAWKCRLPLKWPQWCSGLWVLEPTKIDFFLLFSTKTFFTQDHNDEFVGLHNGYRCIRDPKACTFIPEKVWEYHQNSICYGHILVWKCPQIVLFWLLGLNSQNIPFWGSFSSSSNFLNSDYGLHIFLSFSPTIVNKILKLF